MSFAEDEGYESYYDEDFNASWEDGYHTTKNGDRIEIRLMADTHILNTIKLFKGKDGDTTPLENELKARDLIRNKT